MSIGELFDRYLRRHPAPRRLRVQAHLPLEQLPFLAVDCESTGLDVKRDRIVAFGAIAIRAGLTVDVAPRIDTLIDPCVAIPARSIAVHGIDDAAVAGAPTFPSAFPRIAALLEDNIVVGHHVGFDIALLAAEARRAGLRWREPPFLDTALLLAGLGRRTAGIDLADLLVREGLPVRGRRHSAAGDALMAADLFVELARRLAGQGRGTFGGAVAQQRAPH